MPKNRRHASQRHLIRRIEAPSSISALPGWLAKTAGRRRISCVALACGWVGAAYEQDRLARVPLVRKARRLRLHRWLPRWGCAKRESVGDPLLYHPGSGYHACAGGTSRLPRQPVPPESRSVCRELPGSECMSWIEPTVLSGSRGAAVSALSLTAFGGLAVLSARPSSSRTTWPPAPRNRCATTRTSARWSTVSGRLTTPTRSSASPCIAGRTTRTAACTPLYAFWPCLCRN